MHLVLFSFIVFFVHLSASIACPSDIRARTLNQCDLRLKKIGLFHPWRPSKSYLCGPVSFVNALMILFPERRVSPIEETSFLVHQLGKRMGIEARMGMNALPLADMIRRYSRREGLGLRVSLKGPEKRSSLVQEDIEVSSDPSKVIIAHYRRWRRSVTMDEVNPVTSHGSVNGHYVIIDKILRVGEDGELEVSIIDPGKTFSRATLTPHYFKEAGVWSYRIRGKRKYRQRKVVLSGLMTLSRP